MRFLVFIVEFLNRLVIKIDREVFLRKSGVQRLKLHGRCTVVEPNKLVSEGLISLNHNAYLNASGGIYAGDNVTFSAGCIILTAGLIWDGKPVQGSHLYNSVNIGSNVQIGAGAIVLPGVTICSDVLVGAGAIVSKDILEPGVYVGSPLRKVK